MDNASFVNFYENLKTVFIIVDALLFVFFVFLIVKGWKFRPTFWKIQESEKIYSLGNVVLRERWESIIGRSKINTQESIRHAIIDADDMADELLKRIGFEVARKGDSVEEPSSKDKMSDRLESFSPDEFKSIDRLRSAHQVRNKLVHEPDFKISQEEAVKVLDDYAAFLKEIDVI